MSVWKGAETDTRFEICIAADHPAIAGHFPGHPVVPGALLLAEIVTRLSASGWAITGLRKVRFSLPVRPADVVEVECRPKAGQYRFECRVAGEIVARGALIGPTDERRG